MAFAWQAVFFLPRCADPFDVRCVRASQGALFEVPHYRGKLKDLERLCRKNKLQLCVPHPAGIDIGSAAYTPPPKGVALLIREEYATSWGPPRWAMKIKVPDPWKP